MKAVAARRLEGIRYHWPPLSGHPAEGLRMPHTATDFAGLHHDFS